VAADISTGADDKPVQPGIEPLDVAQRRQVAPGSDQRFLGGVLGEIGVAQDEASGGIQSIDGAAGQHGKGLPVSASCPLDEFRLHASLPSEAADLVALHGTAERDVARFKIRLQPVSR
jgi:hypothetical protein